MILRIEPVTEKNRGDVEKLQVAQEQKNFIEPIEECLAESEGSLEWHSLGIYVKDFLVGYSMYGFIAEENRLWLDRFFIDSRYQGQGYGRKSCTLIIKKLWEDFPKEEKIYLSVYKENFASVALYCSLGFVFIPEKDINGEQVMCLTKSKE